MRLTDKEATKPVTTIVQHTVRPGGDALFEDWSRRIREACRTYPGYMGTEVIKPADEGGCYISIFRFDSYAHLDAWMHSEERQAFLEGAKTFCTAPPKINRYQSLEFMFPLDEATGKPPSREKMAFVTFLGLIAPVYYVPPLITDYITAQPFLATLASLGIITPMMVYAIMPVLTRLFRPWLKR